VLTHQTEHAVYPRMQSAVQTPATHSPEPFEPSGELGGTEQFWQLLPQALALLLLSTHVPLHDR
jgi:hypothetical protein